MEMKKKVYESKTIWICAIALVFVLYQIATTGDIDPQKVYDFLIASGLITLRTSMK